MKFNHLVFLTLILSSVIYADPISKYTEVLEGGAFSSSSIAESNVEVDPAVRSKNCSAFSKFAESSFRARQNGVSAEKMFSVTVNEEPSVKKVMQLIIADSFKYPIKHSGKELAVAASEYASQFYIDCMV